MKQTLLLTTLILTMLITSQAQSKVFKEVSEGISTQIKPIWQDNSMVGYLVFTELEKASEDSFNYKITIMDENLNDIGTVKFRELKLGLFDVALEQDVLCLAYWKSTFVGHQFKNLREYRKAIPDSKVWVFTQFLNLDGKVLATNTIKAEVKPDNYPMGGKPEGTAEFKHSVQLKNISQKGFACFYGDDAKNNLVIYNTTGKQIWQKTVADDSKSYYMMTSHQDVFLLAKKQDKMIEGGYELLGYNTADSTIFPKYILKDKQGNALRVITFDNDPATGRPFLAGSIINGSRGNNLLNANQQASGPYAGVFTVDLAGHRKADIHENYSYWTDRSKPEISRKGRWEAPGVYCRFEQAFRDHEGNTYFSGSAMQRKPKWVSIGLMVATIPTFILPPFIALLSGSEKARLTDGMIVKLGAKGVLSQESPISLRPTSYVRGIALMSYWDKRNYYHLYNSETKNNYLIVDDLKNITVYNVNQKKTLRTIPHKDGNIRTSILPAKEGHIMVSEYNSKEKYTRVSIESL